jgi:hypothetical protein
MCVNNYAQIFVKIKLHIANVTNRLFMKHCENTTYFLHNNKRQSGPGNMYFTAGNNKFWSSMSTDITVSEILLTAVLQFQPWFLNGKLKTIIFSRLNQIFQQ